MSLKQSTTARGRRQLLLVAAVFALPLALAAWMYYFNPALVPDSSTNKGALLLPIVSIAEELPQSEILKISDNQWLMLYADSARCGGECQHALVRLRQSRLMLGKYMSRVRRVFLHGDSPLDTVALEEQHAGLITMTDLSLARLLERKRPTELLPGGSYLIDPLGNLVMYFPPNLDPREMVGDIKHLLKLSHIG